jgi:hypothetical protein
MEHLDTDPPGRPPRPEPSWPTVVATTLRLWLERHPIVIGGRSVHLQPLLALARSVERQGLGCDGLERERPAPRSRLAITAVVAGVIVLCAGAAGLVLSSRPTVVQRETVTVLPAPVGPIAGAVRSQDAKVPLPVTLTIPDIGVQTSLIRLGLTAAGALQVPTSTAVAGWYTGSPRPGAIGPAVIAGHIDSRVGPGVFFHLSQLRPGEHVYVRRADGSLAVFRVTAVQSYAKDRFPTLAVYGPTPDAELRLITCGGTFDPQLRSYLSNIVVYAVQASGNLQ